MVVVGVASTALSASSLNLAAGTSFSTCAMSIRCRV
jgi:hypothetical protein